jgi:hypothetical protein
MDRVAVRESRRVIDDTRVRASCQLRELGDWGSRGGAMALAVAIMAAPVFGITATPTATPIIQRVEGSVLVPGEVGLVAATGVPIDVFPCDSSSCLDAPGVETVETDGDGAFSTSFVSYGLVIVRAAIDTDVLRALTVDGQVLVDPIAEAMVRLLEQRELGSFTRNQLLLIEDAVRRANENETFAGLTIESAVGIALQKANADPAVVSALQPWTPVPNATTTPTPTETSTSTPFPAVSTATPRGCVGDCDASGTVNINEIIAGVAVALGTSTAPSCVAFLDFSISELVRAVDNALEGCAVTPPLPDLAFVPESIGGYGRKCQAPDRCITACVVNSGDADAGPFDVRLMSEGGGKLASTLPGLFAGHGQCVRLCEDGLDFVGTAIVDPAAAVREHRERNNEVPYAIASPTPTFSCP